MQSDEEELKKIKKIEAEWKNKKVYQELEIVDFSDEQKLAFHKYMKNLAQQMLGDTIDLDKRNIVFLLSDNLRPGAAFVSGSKKDSKGPKFIYVTAQLFEFCENKDQLAFVLGHELGHLEKEGTGDNNEAEETYCDTEANNNKAEETYCDTAAVSKMARVGLNIEQANELAKKIFNSKNITVRQLLDVHLSDNNRLLTLGMYIKKLRTDLLNQGETREDVVGTTKVHAIEDEIKDLVKSRPKKERLQDFFLSDEYCNATYEQRVDMWFEKLTEKLRFCQSGIYDEILNIHASVLKKERENLFYQVTPDKIIKANKIDEILKIKEQLLKRNYYFEKKFWDFMLNEPTSDMAKTKRLALKTVLENSIICLPEIFADKMQEKFSGFRTLTDNEAVELAFANLKILKECSFYEAYFRHLISQKLLDLSYTKADVGKEISEKFLQGWQGWLLADVFKKNNIPGVGYIIEDYKYLSDEEVYLLVAENGKIAFVTEDQNELNAKLVAVQINKMVQSLADIQKIKYDDADAKCGALIRAWKLCSLSAQAKDSEQLIDSSGLQTIFLSSEIKYLKLSDLEPYLEPETKEILSGKGKEKYSNLIADMMVEAIQNEFDSDQIRKVMNTVADENLLHKEVWRFPQIEKIAKAAILADANCRKQYKNIANAMLCQHLKEGKNLDDFEFPFKKEFETYKEKNYALNDGLEVYYTFEMLKKEPKIDLSIENSSDSIFGMVIFDKDYFSEHLTQEQLSQIKKRFLENLNNPQNWGGVSDVWTPFKARFNEVIKRYDFNKLSSIRYHCFSSSAVQDVALYFYEHASMDDKIDYFAEALGKTSNETDEEDKRTADKNRIWQVIKKDFENKDISLKDRFALFRKADEHDLFDDNKVHYFETLVGGDGKGGLLKEIDEAPAPKFKYYQQLLRKVNRIPDPDIRAEVVHRAVQAYWQENGCYNDIEATKEERVAFSNKIKNLKNDYLKDVPEVEKREFLRELANVTLSQRELSYAIKPEDFEVNTQDKETIAAAYGLDALSYLMQEKAVNRKTLVEYLLGDGSEKSTQDAVQDCRETLKYSGKLSRAGVNKYLNLIKPQYFRRVKKEFDAAPLEGKAAIINLLSEGHDWEQRFNQVADKLFAEAGELGGIGKKFLKAYIASRPESERCFYLSAMYVAAKNNTVTFDDKSKPYTKEQRSLAQGLRLFLENSGPAGVKLAQAMGSYTGVPDYIRDEMQKAKSNANPPARWEIFEWVDEAKEYGLLDLGYIGEILGSASFYSAFKMKTKEGKDAVVKILRQGARARAEAEFGTFQKMFDLMINEFGWVGSFKRLVDNAASMAEVEADLEIGAKQMRYAKKLYPEKCRADKVDFNIKVMDWIDWGTMWATMEEAKGVDFKDLEQPYKKAAAKAVFVTELSNMLSGKRFDSDRHAGQYKFDTTTNTIGVFDTGSISIVEPTKKEKYVLGVVLARTIQKLAKSSEKTPAVVLCEEIDKGIEHFYAKEIKENKPIPPYLSDFQRGLLALTDFHQEIPAKELSVCIMQALNNGKHKLDSEIYRGITEMVMKNLSHKKDKVSEVIETKESSGANAEESSLMTPEAKMAQNLGRMVAVKVLEEGSIYDVLTTQFNPTGAKGSVVDVLSSSVGQIQFAKGMMKEVVEKIDWKIYDSEQKQQMGRLLYLVKEEETRQKKLHRKVSIAKIFEEKVAQVPQLSGCARYVLSAVRMANEFGLTQDVEMFEKAVLLGRLADKDVQKGYAMALRESPDSSFIKKALSHVSPVALVPEKTSRALVKFMMKKVASKYANMITRMKEMTQKREEHGK